MQSGPCACQTSPEQRYVNVSVVHYTYVLCVDENGAVLESEDEDDYFYFNKRKFLASYPPLPLKLPPEGTMDSIVAVIKGINEAGMSPELWEWWKAHMDA